MTMTMNEYCKVKRVYIILIMLHVYFIILCILATCHAQVEGIYCGKLTCYDVLGVNRYDSLSVFQKAYRKLAKLHHPDKEPDHTKKEEAAAQFRLIATAYEILRDPEQKQEYDYMLDNPDLMYMNYYRYYKRRYSAKVDVRLVIIATILILSTIQYIGQKTRHDQAVNYLMRDPKHRNAAKELAVSEGRFRVNKIEAGRRLNREELKDREESIIRSIIMETVDLRGDCGKPTLRNVLVVQLFFLPYNLAKLTYWAGRWVVFFGILRRPYGLEEQEYVTRKILGFNQVRWEGLEEGQKAHHMRLELWIPERLAVYQEKQAEDLRIRLADDTNQKRYRRYMKKSGPAPINLEDI